MRLEAHYHSIDVAVDDLCSELEGMTATAVMYKKNRSQAARALNVLSQEYLVKKAAKVKAVATSKAA